MSQVRKRAKRAIQRRTEHLAEALRPAPPATVAPATYVGGSRLVSSPVFVLSAPGSGGELLRGILNRHPGITAPDDLGLPSIKVEPKRGYTEDVMGALGLDRQELEHLLWDRVLHHELGRSGKRIVVDDSPVNVLLWRRISGAWPDARFVFLTREGTGAPEYLQALAEARSALTGLTVRHEDLVRNPAAEARRLCDHLGVAWNPDLLG
ncbi:sulfotransferase [Actinocorallia longicatena]|uniref:Sulfotransferase family protein n=1 Tax=Actinocorallia longicatena TaxID=111803 RepID=A0ABP6PVH7_9ACTN